MRHKVVLALLLTAAVCAGAPSCKNEKGRAHRPAAGGKSAPAAASAKKQPQPLGLAVDHAVIRANGTDRATVSLSGGKGGEQAEWAIKPQPPCAVIIEQTPRSVILQSTLEECEISVTAKTGFREFTRRITMLKDTADSDGDGFPNAVELTSESDRRNFRAWFTAIAVSQVRHQSDAWPPEKRDCAGLIRFAFSEALKKHDTQTLSRYKYLARSDMPDVRKYNYPAVPMLGDALFRTRPGVFRAADLEDGAFAPFVTAQLMHEANTHFVSRSLDHALPGDLIFYLRFSESTLPYHSMIFVGAEPGGEPALVYHTGPVNNTAGTMKLMTVADLMSLPDPVWHPAPENPNFLGVFRFNILD